MQQDVSANIKIMIVDDEPAGRRAIRECCARHPDLTVIGEFGDPRAALQAIHSAQPEVVFLDIRMETLSGIEVARALDDPPPIVVFVTAYDEYAVEAFEPNAVDYLLQPFDDARFDGTLQRVRQRHRAETDNERERSFAALLERLDERRPTGYAAPQRLLAESGGAFHMVNVADIEIVEASRSYVKLTVGRETFNARSTLQRAEELLDRQPLLRISRSCIVNSRHIKEINRTPRGDFIVVLAGGVTVTSSEGYRSKVRQYFDTLRLAPR